MASMTSLSFPLPFASRTLRSTRLTFGATPLKVRKSAVDELYKKSNFFASKSLAEMVAAIARLPLAHQPGEFWEYSVSTDVLGRIVEVVSGMELDRFVAERITGPLKMTDTGFYQIGRASCRENVEMSK